MRHCYIIAEAGVNHNGSMELALQLVAAAAAAGADAVKFQTFRAASTVSASAPKAEYQINSTGPKQTQLEMLRALELDEASHHLLKAHCLVNHIDFLSTPFDLPSVDLLADRLKVSRLKLPSGEITNAPLLLKAASKGLPIILSTGMSHLGEVEEALGVLACGLLGKTARLRRSDFRSIWSDPLAIEILKDRVSLLHCTTEYPAPYESVNLRAMDTLKAAFGLPVGLSDHTIGTAIPIAAVARGAQIIEKHFTLDRHLPGPDHAASLTPQELTEMVASIRATEAALGHALKCPAPVEFKNILAIRRSIMASRPIAAGEAFGPDNLTIKRPAGGRSPMDWFDTLGRKAERNYGVDEAIDAP